MESIDLKLSVHILHTEADKKMGLDARKPVFRGSNHPAQLQRVAKILKFCMKLV